MCIYMLNLSQAPYILLTARKTYCGNIFRFRASVDMWLRLKCGYYSILYTLSRNEHSHKMSPLFHEVKSMLE